MSDQTDPITPARVCKTLEGMCLLDLHEREPTIFADHVYTFCHIASGRCANPHLDWQKTFLEMEKIVLTTLDAPNNQNEQTTSPSTL